MYAAFEISEGSLILDDIISLFFNKNSYLIIEVCVLIWVGSSGLAFIVLKQCIEFESYE